MNPLSRIRIETRRELTRRGLGTLYERIHQILLDHNPIGVDVTKGDARDDYGLPVGTLIPKLTTINEGDLARVLFAEMQHWYREAAGATEGYDAIAHDIWRAWTEFQRR
jgi:hypothetical protein